MQSPAIQAQMFQSRIFQSPIIQSRMFQSRIIQTQMFQSQIIQTQMIQTRASQKNLGRWLRRTKKAIRLGPREPAIAGEATPGFAALSDIDQALVIGLNTYDWDTQPWVSADIESIDVPEGTDFSVTLTLENFTESPIFALACDATFAGEFFTAAVAGRQYAVLPTCYHHLRQRRGRCDHYYLNRRGRHVGALAARDPR